MYELLLTRDENHMNQILALQQKYLKSRVEQSEIASEGFLTVEHSPEILAKMHSVTPHAVAIYNQEVVGYALAMSPIFQKDIPVLIPMFKKFDTLEYRSHKLANYLVMGQICIDQAHRRTGLFKQLYYHLFTMYRTEFNYLVTEISASNEHSLEAHYALGFKTISKYIDETDEWHIVLWDW